MEATRLAMVIDCSGGSIRNDALQPASDPILQLTLETQDGQCYLLPLSERGAARVFEVISNWRQSRDFLSELEPPEPAKRQ
jgi:hypothetical protein